MTTLARSRPGARRPRASASRQLPISCSPSRPRPSSTSGNAVPSFSPASPVSAKRRRSRSPGSATCSVGSEHRIGRREDAAEQDGARRAAGRARARRRRRSAPRSRSMATGSPGAAAAASGRRSGRRSSSGPSRTATAGTTISASCSSALVCSARRERGPAEPERADRRADRQAQHRGAERQPRRAANRRAP